ncbi:histone-like nucleoid-structuring protein, MvaT/MvaU family [Pseudomonas sp. OV226]|jgi:hypothetical protein|uniref:histone-like nucleoid-structuring protein, MvaT/MvaU family n=1 Tax=Pseudomonas sp. OV226 TaxID=2135588 RepID=UPI000D6AF133|nr:histone-like nucleoid-structuring protein, MvaT/MvaU family [Pseudomonas sp. OV226]PWK28753.1 H-NS family protein MvaT [Pseudomonas sp. OV226]
MSKLIEFRELEKHLAEQLAALETMKSDTGLKREIEFEKKLRDLLSEYGYSLKNIIALFDPYASHQPRVESGIKSRKARAVKVYKNPHSGELVETKGGNHKTLKQWKSQYGANTVESWLTK